MLNPVPSAAVASDIGPKTLVLQVVYDLGHGHLTKEEQIKRPPCTFDLLQKPPERSEEGNVCEGSDEDECYLGSAIREPGCKFVHALSVRSHCFNTVRRISSLPLRFQSSPGGSGMRIIQPVRGTSTFKSL